MKTTKLKVELDIRTRGVELIHHIFTRVFVEYGYSIRDEQVDLSKRMYLAMLDKKISLSDIPVGLGKTHAYLIAGVVFYLMNFKMGRKAKPVIVTTSSIELQKAITEDYLPEISKMLEEFCIISKPISFVLRKGKENYLCDRRYAEYYKNIKKHKRIEELLVLEHIERSGEIDLDKFAALSNYDKKRISVNTNVCLTCNLMKTCRYMKHLNKSITNEYVFQICNHNYFLADILRKKEGLTELIPDYNTVVVDEAHKLSNASRQMFGTSLNQMALVQIINKCRPSKITTKKQRIINYYCKDILPQINDLFDSLVKKIENRNDECLKYSTLIDRSDRLIINSMVSNLKMLVPLINNNWSLHRGLEKVIKSLEEFQRWNIIYWIEYPDEMGKRELFSIPVDITTVLREYLWKDIDSIILTSGTLAVNRDFTYIRDELGIKNLRHNRVNSLSKPSPFDYYKNCGLYIADDLPFPDYCQDYYIKRLSEKIKELIIASNGHALVLFTSYRPLNQVYDKIVDQVDIPIIQMTRGNKSSIDQFKKTDNGVLFATGSAWEGIDISGDLLSSVIIVKLPFPVPDPISKYESGLYMNRDKFMEKVIIPRMLMKLKQGAGRLIRGDKDTGVITILDRRCSKGERYHEAVVDALPDCKQLDNIKEVKGFFQMKKPLGFLEEDVVSFI